MRIPSPHANRNADRAATEVIATIVLFGIIVGAAGFVVGLGNQAMQDTHTQAETKHAQNAFSQLDSKASESALGQTGSSNSLDLGTKTSRHSDVKIARDGEITITSENISTGNTKTVAEQSLGAIIYENKERTIAYQGGGVFEKEVGDNRATLVSPPEIRYRGNTLTMPLVVLDENSQYAADAHELHFERNKRTSVVTSQQRMEGHRITVEITSEYYQAWGDHFENRVGDKTNVTYDHDSNTVHIDLGLPESATPHYDGGLVSTGDVISADSADVDGPVLAEGQVKNVNSEDGVHEYADTRAKTIDPVVHSYVQYAKNEGEHLGVIDTSMRLDEGLYYAEGIAYNNAGKYETEGVSGNGDGHLRLHAVGNNSEKNDGNLTLVVDGDINLGQSSTIYALAAGNNRSVKVYTTGDVRLTRGSPVAEGNVPENLQIYGTSETDLVISQSATFRGLFYAPTDNPEGGGKKAMNGKGALCQKHEYDVCVGANADIEGAIVGGTMRVHNDASIEYRESLSMYQPTVAPVEVRPRLIYLHVSFNHLRVEATG